MTRTQLKAALILMGLLTPICLFFSWAYFSEYLERTASSQYPIVHGQVISSSKGKFRGVSRPAVHVKIEGTQGFVTAILSANSDRTIPRHVSFHFSGDTSKEVLLEEETSPLLLALVLFCLPTLCFAFGFWELRKGRLTQQIHAEPAHSRVD